MTRFFQFVLIFLAFPAVAFAWPSGTQWEPVELRGAPLTDPFNDGAKDSRDIVGDAANPAAYYYRDASGVYLRMRLDKSPIQGSGFAPFGWGVVLEFDGDLSAYDAIVWVTGVGSSDVVSLYANTVTSTRGVCDTAETEVDSAPAAERSRVVAAASSFGGDGDAFLDFFIPAAALAALPVPPTGDVIQFLFGTSNSGNPTLDADIAGAGTNDCTLAAFVGVVSDPPPGATVTDTDGDGMPDYWENQHPCLDAAVNDAAGDADGDGLTNLEEYEQGTNPCDADSDGDGVDDGADNCAFTANGDQADRDGDGLGDLCDPDIDGDGLPNGDEEALGTDPNAADTDGDGIDDKTEIEQGTDPLDDDTDNDGYADGRDNCPAVRNPDQLDYDGDGLGDACETDAVPWLGGGAMGCASASGAWWPLAWMVLALALLRRRRWAPAVALAFFPEAARALQTERYSIVPSPLGWNAVEQFDVADPLDASAGFFLNYAKDPVVYRLNGEIDRKVVSGRVGGELVANLGLVRRVELGVAVPAVLYQTGEGFDPPRLGDPPPAFAMGDLRVKPRIALLTQDETGGDWGVTLVPGLSLPTAREDGLAGSGGVAYVPEIVAGLRLADWSFAVNAGAVFRPEERVRGLAQDDAATYRAAVAYRMLAVPGLTYTGEVLGETAVKKPFADAAGNPLEVMFGALYEIMPGVQLSAAAGPGLTPGLGTPVLRAVAGVRWAPRSDVGPFAGAPRRPGKGAALARVAGRRIELRENVHFLSGRSTINPTSHDLLDAVVKILRDDPSLELRIVGHTDDVGSAELNQKLSEERAKAVRRYMVKKGISGDRLTAAGEGESNPIVGNDTESGREKNRRVEFLVE